MANIKEVRIQYRLPFTWLQDLPESEAACMAYAALIPAGGLRMRQDADGFDHNSHGGSTSMYLVTIQGREGCSYRFLNRIVGAFDHVVEVARQNGVDARKIVAEACDIQWPNEVNRWEDLRSEYYPDRQETEA